MTDFNICEQFLINPNINPRSGKPISRGDPMYNSLIEDCKRHGYTVPTELKTINPECKDYINIMGKLVFDNLYKVYDEYINTIWKELTLSNKYKYLILHREEKYKVVNEAKIKLNKSYNDTLDVLLKKEFVPMDLWASEIKNWTLHAIQSVDILKETL